MRRRSEKRRNHQNHELVEEYRANNRSCELCRAGLGKMFASFRKGLECHHIWFPPRWDVLSNLIMLCPQHHDWATDRTHEQRVVCMYVKFLKGEFDIGELDRISGKNVAGIIEMAMVDFPSKSDAAYCARKLYTELEGGCDEDDKTVH